MTGQRYVMRSTRASASRVLRLLVILGWAVLVLPSLSAAAPPPVPQLLHDSASGTGTTFGPGGLGFTFDFDAQERAIWRESQGRSRGDLLFVGSLRQDSGSSHVLGSDRQPGRSWRSSTPAVGTPRLAKCWWSTVALVELTPSTGKLWVSQLTAFLQLCLLSWLKATLWLPTRRRSPRRKSNARTAAGAVRLQEPGACVAFVQHRPQPQAASKGPAAPRALAD